MAKREHVTTELAPRPGNWTSNGLELHYVEWGSRSNPTIVVHHGFLVVVDARGHGDSAWIGAGGSYYFPDYLFDMKQLHEHLGIDALFMVGHSMGGAVVTYFSGAFPAAVRGVVTVEGLGPPPGHDTNMKTHSNLFVATLKRALEKRAITPMQDLNEAISRMRRADPLLDHDTAKELANHATREHPGGGVIWKFDPLHRARSGMPFVEDHARQLWSSITAPVLLIRGGKSRFPMLDYEARTNTFQSLTELTIPEAGHNLHAHQPALLAAAVQEFFEPLL